MAVALPRFEKSVVECREEIALELMPLQGSERWFARNGLLETEGKEAEGSK